MAARQCVLTGMGATLLSKDGGFWISQVATNIYYAASSPQSNFHILWHQHHFHHNTSSIKRSQSDSDLRSLQNHCLCGAIDPIDEARHECSTILEEAGLSMGSDDEEDAEDEDDYYYEADAQDGYPCEDW